MSRSGILILLSVLSILVPFSGLPVGVRTFLTVVLGIGILGIGLAIRSQQSSRNQSSELHDSPAHLVAEKETAPQGVSPI